MQKHKGHRHTDTQQTYCWIRILNNFSSSFPLPVFFFPCPRICPPSRKSLFISDKAMGHAVIVGLLSKNYSSTGSTPIADNPPSWATVRACSTHGSALQLPLGQEAAGPGAFGHHKHPWHTPCNGLPREKLKSHPTFQSYPIQ